MKLSLFLALGLTLISCQKTSELTDKDIQERITKINQHIINRDMSKAEKMVADIISRSDVPPRLKFQSFYYLYQYYLTTRFGLSKRPLAIPGVEVPYEEVILAQLENTEPPRHQTPFKGNFSAYVAEALGTKNIYPKPGRVELSPKEPYEGGTLQKGKIIYDSPPVSVQFRFAPSPVKDKPLVIVLPGHLGASSRVMGLGKYDDYMHKIGQALYKEGFSVIAFDLTSSMSRSAQVNKELLLYNVQIYGLWARAVDDVAAHFEKKGPYKTISLFGYSNGGLVADFISTLSSRYQKIVVGDAFLDLRALAHKHPTIWALQNYSIYFLRPLAAETSVVDFFLNSKSQKFYTVSQNRYSQIMKQNKLESKQKEGIKKGRGSHFVIRANPGPHEVDVEQTLHILTGKLDKERVTYLKSQNGL